MRWRGREVDPFTLWLVGATVLGLAIRLVYVFVFRQHTSPAGDDLVYHLQANLVADGKGWASPLDFQFTGEVKPQADHPPLYVAFLALFSLVGLDSQLAHLTVTAVAGTATIVLTGLLGRRVAGERAGAIAAVLLALYPGLWAWDGRTLSEGPAALLTTAAVLAAVRARAEPSTRTVAAVALLGTLAGLARAEMLLLVPLLIAPLVWQAGDRRVQLRWLAVAVAVPAVLIGPWAVYNTARFEEPVILSTGLGRAMASSDCDPGFRGDLAGYWKLDCLTPMISSNPGLDESQYDGLWREEALEYVGDHVGEVPGVVARRWARATYLYRPTQQLELDQVAEGKEDMVAGSGMTTFYLLSLLAAAGAVALRRRGQALWPFVAPVLCVMLGIAIAFGSVRYRAPVEGVVVVLAGVGMDAVCRRAERRGWRAAPALAGALAVFLAVAAVGAHLGTRHDAGRFIESITPPQD